MNKEIDKLSFDEKTCTYLELPMTYLSKSGLPDDQNLMLYCRPRFIEQFKFLQQRVIDNGIYGWILGPPGTGKSSTALAFASILNKDEWNVTWIHLSRMEYHLCIRFQDDLKQSRPFDYSELSQILPSDDGKRKNILFIDGFNDFEHGFDDHKIQRDCFRWLQKNRKDRRLVLTSSMSCGFNSTSWGFDMNKVELFHVYSWTLNEYKEAIKDVDFFNSIKENLDSSDVENSQENSIFSSSPAELVESKFYFAGGSCAFMFYYKTNKVIEHLEDSVKRVDDVISYIKGTIGDMSNNVTNRLYSLYPPREYSFFGKQTWIISCYAAISLSLKIGPDLVIALSKVLHYDYDPAMDLWMLEMWFYANLCMYFWRQSI